MKLPKWYPVFWFTGLSSSGKTTLAFQWCSWLKSMNIPSIVLDGDQIRELMKVTGFDKDSRIQHIRNVGRLASFLANNEIIPIVSLISPYREVREECRAMAVDFIEIYLSTPIEVCQKRDPKGLYAKALVGEIKSFTGIHPDAPYEVPLNPELTIDTSIMPETASLNLIYRQFLMGIPENES